MAKLSVIIVNYNVKYFLDQALRSVLRASEGLDIETIVVDNNSSDGSVEMVEERFPEVKLIANKENTGFSKANNQGIEISTGEYVLLLNPDTVVEEDCFSRCLQFMEDHPDCGGLGVKMVDGKGQFLPESKRSLPTPAVSFFKIFGLASLFPKSKMFGRYHLGYLSEMETHVVDVLPGAFMMMPRKVLDQIGYLDEDFFMYGEDVDLSYRIQLGGYKNYYFPEVKIIHYKGESTKKGSLNYVRIFYQAMSIFAAKHFSKSSARFYSFVISIAIYLRALMALVSRAISVVTLPLFDVVVLYAGMWVIKDVWTTMVVSAADYYPAVYMNIVVPAYILVWVVALYFSGGYDKPIRAYRTVRGVLFGTLIIATIYAFLPNNWRYSRGMILVGSVWATFTLVLIRYMVGYLSGKKPLLKENDTTRIIIVGGDSEAKRALSLISQAGVESRYVGFVSPYAKDKLSEHYLADLDSLYDVRHIYSIKEVIFCSADVPVKTIINFMTVIGPELNYKILPEGSDSIIGSNSKNTAGDLYAIDINLAISTTMNRRNKRLLDIVVCLVTLVTYPIGAFFYKDPMQYIKNWWLVLFGRKSWVGYAPTENGHRGHYWLPPLRPGVLDPVDMLKKKNVDDRTKGRLNLLYAKDYKVFKDLRIVIKNFRCLGSC